MACQALQHARHPLLLQGRGICSVGRTSSGQADREHRRRQRRVGAAAIGYRSFGRNGAGALSRKMLLHAVLRRCRAGNLQGKHILQGR